MKRVNQDFHTEVCSTRSKKSEKDMPVYSKEKLIETTHLNNVSQPFSLCSRSAQSLRLETFQTPKVHFCLFFFNNLCIQVVIYTVIWPVQNGNLH